MNDLLNQALAIFLISLRFTPTFTFAPPFNMMRIPVSARVLLALSLATWIVLSNPAATFERPYLENGFLAVFFRELLVGTLLAFAMLWAHGAVLTAGRALDIQAGFGMALLLDPTTNGQIPLIGTVFAYTTAAIFFAIGGPTELLFIWAESVERLPLGAAMGDIKIPVLLGYIGTAYVLAIGLAGVVFFTLFLIDLTVAFMSRTLPQMNVLLIGFQVKTLAVLLTLPLAISWSSALFLRLIRVALQTTPQLI